MAEDDELAARRRALEETLKAREETDAAAASKRNPSSMASYAVAFRMSTEFISAVVVGGVIGFAADKLLGTLPWLMILFLLLGFVAGVLNVLRSTGLIQSPQIGKRPAKRGDEPPET